MLAKPLDNGDIAIAFFNLKSEEYKDNISISANQIISSFGNKMSQSAAEAFRKASSYELKDLFSKEFTKHSGKDFSIDLISACDCKVYRISPVK